MATFYSPDPVAEEANRGAWRHRLLRDNPLFGTLMGLCPALAVSYRVDNALALGAAVFVILLVSAATFALVGERVPRRFRFALDLLVTSCLATVAERLFRAYDPALATRLGIYVPLIAVNCMVLAATTRGAAPASFGRVMVRATGDGLGFFVALVVISLVREVLGSGTITLFKLGGFGGVIHVGGLESHPVSLLVYSSGAFLVLGYLQALSLRLGRKQEIRA